MESLKKRKFRLGTTSFIYPDHIIPNVRKTGRFFDEIELLVFESLPEDVIPSKDDIRELKLLGEDLNLTYNVHLPVDVSLTAGSALERQKAADTLTLVLERFSPLTPTTHTLHLDMDRDLSDPDEISSWKDRARKGLELWIPHLDEPGLISVETLWYDPIHFSDMVKDYDLSVCLDAGHHFKYGYALSDSFTLFDNRIPLIHLHGVDFDNLDSITCRPKDHQGLDRLPESVLDQVIACLETYTGTVSLEVFNLKNLTSSLTVLGRSFEDISHLPLNSPS